MKNNYIIIGDSIVYGIGGYTSGGWTSLLKKEFLKNDNSQVSNYVHVSAYPGSTSSDILNRIDDIINTFYFEAVFNIFIVSIGVNDTQKCAGQNKVSQEIFANNIQNIINKISSYKNSKIIFLGLTSIKDKNNIFTWKSDKYYDYQTIYQYDKELQAICGSNNIAYVPMLDVLNEFDYIDGLHPNDSGHEKIFAKVKKVISTDI